MKYTIAKYLARLIDARANCEKNGIQEWFTNHSNRLKHMEKCYLPSGSGFDNGTKIDLVKSDGNKLVLETSFHHMNSDGYYDGWTQHVITVTPSFIFGLNIKISGRNKNDIKDYIHETFNQALNAEIEE